MQPVSNAGYLRRKQAFPLFWDHGEAWMFSGRHPGRSLMTDDTLYPEKIRMTSLAEEIGTCRKCPLSASRTRTVPGEGPVPCRVMLVGEGPGRKEDESGRPFVGRAGTILSELLLGIGLLREEVFLTSVVKCRPPGNRAPKSGEIAACMPFLDRQMALLSPEFLVPMGQVAVSSIFSRYHLPFPSFKEVRGKMFLIRDDVTGKEIQVIPVYHPAVITHNPPARSALEQDFQNLAVHLSIL